MFLRHVKHTTTAWPMLIFPFHHEVNVYGHRRKVFSFPVAFHSYATSWEKAKGTKSKACCTNGPQLNFFFSRHRVAHGEISDTSLYRSSTDLSFFFFTPPRGTGWNFPTLRSIGLRPICHSFFPFFSLSRHLVAQGEISWHIALSFLYRFFPFFFTPSRDTGTISPTHRPFGPRPILPFFSRHLISQGEISRGKEPKIHDALLKRSTQLCGQTNK